MATKKNVLKQDKNSAKNVFTFQLANHHNEHHFNSLSELPK